MLCPSSMRRWDSNPGPSEHKSPPITTRPRLLLYSKALTYLFGIKTDLICVLHLQ